jgi:hypothetical protein
MPILVVGMVLARVVTSKYRSEHSRSTNLLDLRMILQAKDVTIQFW